MKSSKMLYLVMTFILTLTLALPAGAFAASSSTKSILDACTFTADKTSLTVSSDASKNTGLITVKCDTSKVAYSDITASVEDEKIVSITYSNGLAKVKAVGAGFSMIHLAAPGYSRYVAFFEVKAASGNEAVTDTNSKTDTGIGEDDNEDTSTNEEAPLDPRIQQLQDYAAQIKPLAKDEDTAANTYSNYRIVSSKNRKQAVAAFDKTIIPTYTRFVKNLKAVKPGNADLVAIHQLYIKGSALQLEGFNLMRKAIGPSKTDTKLFKQANDKLTAGSKLIDQYGTKLTKYAQGLSI